MIDLTKFCSRDRTSLLEPWSRGDYTYATDGHIGIRVHRRADVGFEGGPDFEAMSYAIPAATRLEPLPQITVPNDPKCSVCKGLGYVVECANCDGTGYVECMCCGSEKSCDQCHDGAVAVRIENGHPVITSDADEARECEACHGTGSHSYSYGKVYVEVVPRYFLQGYIVRLMQSLPDVKIDVGVELGAPMRFTFDGGDGIAMPLRPGSEATAAVVVRARGSSRRPGQVRRHQGCSVCFSLAMRA